MGLLLLIPCPSYEVDHNVLHAGGSEQPHASINPGCMVRVLSCILCHAHNPCPAHMHITSFLSF